MGQPWFVPFELDREGSSVGAGEAVQRVRTSKSPCHFHIRPAFCLAERAVILGQPAVPSRNTGTHRRWYPH